MSISAVDTFFHVTLTVVLLPLQMGHLKTVIILAGGFVLFDEKMPAKKLGGVLLALVGIVWYSGLKMQKASAPPAQQPGKGGQKAAHESEPLVGSKEKKMQATA